MKHHPSVIFLMLAFFVLTQLIGLIVIKNYMEIKDSQMVWKTLPSVGPFVFDRPEIEQNISFIYVISAILIGTLLFFLLIRFKVNLLWKAWFFLAIFLCLYISFFAFFSQTTSAVIAFILTFLKIFRPSIITHNLSELFIYGGLSAIFVPLFNQFSVSVLLILISIYDMYAVWKSKHMIELAKFQMKSGTFAGILFPYKKEKVVKKEIKVSKIPSPKRMQLAVLGGGDVSFPLMFASVMFVDFGWSALIISLFASFGLLGLFILGKKGKFYPAMPFISIGCFAGYGILLLARWFL